MANRREWKFPINIQTLKEKAQERLDHERGRVEFYEAEVARYEEEYRQSVKVDRPVVENRRGHTTTSVLADHHIRVEGDPEIYQAFMNARSRLSDHSEKIVTFERWLSLFDTVPDPDRRTLEIDIEDAHFFGV